MNNPLNVVTAIGLALGSLFGLVGTVVTEQCRAASWGIDGVGRSDLRAMERGQGPGVEKVG